MELPESKSQRNIVIRVDKKKKNWNCDKIAFSQLIFQTTPNPHIHTTTTTTTTKNFFSFLLSSFHPKSQKPNTSKIWFLIVNNYNDYSSLRPILSIKTNTPLCQCPSIQQSLSLKIRCTSCDPKQSAEKLVAFLTAIFKQQILLEEGIMASLRFHLLAKPSLENFNF